MSMKSHSFRYNTALLTYRSLFRRYWREKYAPIAQLDRVPGYELGGRTFESCWVHHPIKKGSFGPLFYWILFLVERTCPFEKREAPQTAGGCLANSRINRVLVAALYSLNLERGSSQSKLGLNKFSHKMCLQ